MPFRETQLGRFGVLCMQHFVAHNDPDIRAAHALANNGAANPQRRTLQADASNKMLIDINNPTPAWTNWQAVFQQLVTQYGRRPLMAECTKK